MKTILISVALILFLIVGLCACKGSVVDAPNSDNALSAIGSYMREKEFMAISDEQINKCVQLVEYNESKRKYKFEIEYNPAEIFPDYYDKTDEIAPYKNTLFVIENEDVYSVMNEQDECLFVYNVDLNNAQ